MAAPIVITSYNYSSVITKTSDNHEEEISVDLRGLINHRRWRRSRTPDSATFLHDVSLWLQSTNHRDLRVLYKKGQSSMVIRILNSVRNPRVVTLECMKLSRRHLVKAAGTEACRRASEVRLPVPIGAKSVESFLASVDNENSLRVVYRDRNTNKEVSLWVEKKAFPGQPIQYKCPIGDNIQTMLAYLYETSQTIYDAEDSEGVVSLCLSEESR